MTSKNILFFALVLSLTLALAGCNKITTTKQGGESATTAAQEQDTTAPIISVVNVPSACNVGDTVTIPAATATDDKDGDVSSKIKVTVSQMKADGTTVNRDIIYEKAGNVEQSFTVSSNTLLVYVITYSVKDSSGNKATAKFTLTALEDNETGTFTLNENSSENYKDGKISAMANATVTLPSGVAIDQPGDVDISSQIEARLYEKIGGEYSTNVFNVYKDFTETKQVSIPAGEYKLVYTVKDIAGNAFEQTYEIEVNIAIPYGENLADPSNFVIDEKPGMGWVNEFGEIAFGNTSAQPNLEQTVGMTESITKIYQQYIGFSFIIDEPGVNGAMFYSVSARGSKDRTSAPNKETCTWPSYLFIRFSNGKIESRVEKSTDKEMTRIIDYKGNLLDGKQHTVYMQWKNYGETWDAADASIIVYGWIDCTPEVGYENASFAYKTVAGDAIDVGTLSKDLFKELWEETGAGWFAMDTYSGSRPYGDDHFTLKGFAIYEENATDFSLDITAPVVSASFDADAIYAIGEEMTLPEAIVEGTDSYKVIIVKADGTKVEVTGGKFTPTEAGDYRLIYEATDEAGNTGYVYFDFKASARDDEAPALTISSEETLSCNVGESVTLPTASAIDNLEGDLSQQIAIEIKGTEHVTNLVPGDVYYPMTAGTQQVTYYVSDSFGNRSEKTITVNVTSTSKGNILESPITAASGGNGLRSGEKIYNQKVSTIINIEKFGTLIMFNVRGDIGSNSDWPNGMVMRIDKGTNKIDISAKGHDSCIFGSATWDLLKYMQGVDTLFEYQVSNVTIGGEEYIKFQIWMQGEELVFSAQASNGGIVGLEEGSKAIYRKVSDFQSEGQRENVYSSAFWMVGYNATATIKEMRIDGTSCEMPEGPKAPEGFEKIVFEQDNAFVECPVQIASNDGNQVVLGKNSNESYIAITFKGQDVKKGAFCVNITGEISNYGWAGGLVLRATQDGFELRAGGSNATTVAYLNGLNMYPSGINSTEYTIAYKLTYVYKYDLIVGVQVDVWAAKKGESFVKMIPTLASEVATYDAESDTLIVKSSAFSSKADITPSNITVVVLDALNGGCTWEVTAIEKLSKEPGQVKVEGYQSPLNTKAPAVLLTEETEYKSTSDSVVKLVENVNENYITVEYKNAAGASYPCIGINILGQSAGWDGGLTLRMCPDGNMLKLNGINADSLSQLKIWDGDWSNGGTIVYKLTYIMTEDVVTAIQLDMWYKKADGELTKVEPYTISNDKVKYDEANKAFIFEYSLFSEAQITPDCTFISLSAFNDKDVDSDISIVKVSASAKSPEYVAPTINENAKGTYLGTTDSVVKMVNNLDDSYVTVSFKSNEGASYPCIGINILGQSSGWDGGVVMRFCPDGNMLKIGGVNANDLAQLKIWDGAWTDGCEVTYRVQILEDGTYKFEIWYKKGNGEVIKAEPYTIANDKLTYNESEGAFYLAASAFESALKADCTVVILQAFNDKDVDSEFVIENAKLSAKDPTYVVPTANESAVKEYAGAVDNVVKMANNLNNDYIVSVTFDNNKDASYPCIGFNMIGQSSGWDGGLVMKFSKDGVYLMLNGVNATTIAQLKIWQNSWDEKYTFEYRVQVLSDGSYKINMWYGKTGEELSVVEPHAISNELLTYNEADGSFILSAKAFESALKADCTMVMLGAFNDKDVDTIVNIYEIKVREA